MFALAHVYEPELPNARSVIWFRTRGFNGASGGAAVVPEQDAPTHQDGHRRKGTAAHLARLPEPPPFVMPYAACRSACCAEASVRAQTAAQQESGAHRRNKRERNRSRPRASKRQTGKPKAQASTRPEIYTAPRAKYATFVRKNVHQTTSTKYSAMKTSPTAFFNINGNKSEAF